MSKQALEAKDRAASYQEDFYLWLLGQAEMLRAGRVDELDLENLAEELRGEVRAERALAEATFRLLLLAHCLAHRQAPDDWWQPFLQSLMLHFPNGLMPLEFLPEHESWLARAAREFAETQDVGRSYKAGYLGEDLQAFLERQLSRSPSLACYLSDQVDGLFVEVSRLATHLTDGSHTEGIWRTLSYISSAEWRSGHGLVFETNLPGRDSDRYAWLKSQVALLSVRGLGLLDIEGLSREVAAIAKRDERALESRMDILLTHLLKYQHQPKRRGASWKHTIQEQRRQIQRILKDSPSLRRRLDEIVFHGYPQAREQAHSETRLPLGTFPDACPYALEQLLDEDFLPEAKHG